MTERRAAPPGGMAPPASAPLPGGGAVALAPLAERVAERHLERHPEDLERYGSELAHAWCVHDNQHLLAWAIGDIDFAGQLAWLARVLESRGYPGANLRDDVLTGAEVVRGELPSPLADEVAERMIAAARELQV